MASGGVRQGAPGKAYPNRSDLNADRQAPRAPAGRPYGERKAAMDAQRTIPLPAQSGPRVIPLDAPTERPDEPLTAGLSTGAGPGPEALMPTGLPVQEMEIIANLRAMYRAFPSNDLLRFLERLDRSGR